MLNSANAFIATNQFMVVVGFSLIWFIVVS